MIRDPILLSLVVAAVAAMGFGLEQRFAWAQRLGASLLIILAAALLSNLGLVPPASVVYDVIGGPLTSLAIVWLLLAVDLRDLRAAGPRMLGAFGLAVLGSALGAWTAAQLFGAALGDATWRLAGVMTGTYAGGSVNFVSVGRTVGLEDAMFTAATAADNVMTTVWIGATLMLPIWLRRFYPPRRALASSNEDAGATRNPFQAAIALRPFDILALAAIGLAVVAAAEAAATWTPAVPAVVWLTSFALCVAQLPWVRRLPGALILGLISLNLFFVVIGVGSRVAEIFRVGPEVFYFTVTVIAIHGIVIFGGARLLGFDVETTAVASQAAVGGPSTAIALAAARGWRDLALPGAVVGLLGYAVGTYAGLAVAYLVR